MPRWIQPFAAPLRDELARSWPALLGTAALAGAGLAVAIPASSLRPAGAAANAPLEIEPLAGIGPVVSWTPAARGPAATQAAALHELLPVLAAAGGAVLALALIAVLARLAAQAHARAAEIAIRRAVGASRRHILVVQLVEGGGLMVAAALVGGVGAALALRAGLATWPGPTGSAPPRFALPVLLAAATFALGAVLPLTHRSARRLAGGNRMPVTLGLPAIQVAAALAALCAGTVLLRHAHAVAGGPADPAGPAMAPGTIWEVGAAGSAPAARAAAYARLLGRVAAPGSGRVASLASAGAHAGLGTVDGDVTDCGHCVRGMIVLRWLHLDATHHAISPDTFTAAGITLLEGRGIAAEDDWDAPRVAVVNRHLAARYFEAGGAIGRDIYLGTAWPRRPHRVVGIVDDERSPLLGGAAQPRETVYLSVLQHPPAAAELLVRESSPAAEDTLARLAGAGVRVARVESEARRRARDAAPLAWFGWAFGVAGLAALALAVAGTAGTTRLWVESLAGEVALRRAAGATRARVTRELLRRAGLAIAWGAAAGGAVYATLVADHLAPVVPALPRVDAGILAAAAALLVAVALASAYRAARRLTRAAPARWLS